MRVAGDWSEGKAGCAFCLRLPAALPIPPTHLVAPLSSTTGLQLPALGRLPETSTRTTNFLEVMMKLRNARNLDARQSGLIDSAYFAVRAADRAVKRKQRQPQQEYIRHLVYEKLPLGQVAKVR